MTRKTSKILAQDSTLRLMYAFHHFVATNKTWESDSSATKKNREISSKLGYDLDDEYFLFNGNFYSFNYTKRDEDAIECEIREYNRAYELADEMTSLSFDYVISTQEIINVSEQKVSIGVTISSQQPQKVIK